MLKKLYLKLKKLIKLYIKKLLKPRIKYVSNIPNGFAGKFYGYPFFPTILILPQYKNDTGLLQHELTHYKQYLRSFMLWEILYLFDDIRLKWEVEAYKRQLQFVSADCYDEMVEKFAFDICTKYDLVISIQKLKDLLLNGINNKTN